MAVASLAGLRAAAGQSATDPSATASRAASERIVDFSFRPTPLRVSPGTRIGGELNLNTFGDYNEFKSLIGIRQQLGGGNE